MNIITIRPIHVDHRQDHHIIDMNRLQMMSMMLTMNRISAQVRNEILVIHHLGLIICPKISYQTPVPKFVVIQVHMVHHTAIHPNWIPMFFTGPIVVQLKMMKSNHRHMMMVTAAA